MRGKPRGANRAGMRLKREPDEQRVLWIRKKGGKNEGHTASCRPGCCNLFLRLCDHPGAENPPVLKVRKATLSYQGGKIAVPDEIEGYRLAVGVLRNALIDSLLDLYTETPKTASYRIAGSLFAKKHWRKRRLFVYYNVNLRLLDNDGNLIMTFSNPEPFYQTELAEFTDLIVKAIRE